MAKEEKATVKTEEQKMYDDFNTGTPVAEIAAKYQVEPAHVFEVVNEINAARVENAKR